jgi:hypothetical protein
MPFASWSVLTVDFLVVLHLAMGGVTLAALAAPRQCQMALRHPLYQRLILRAVSARVRAVADPAVQRRQDLPLGGLAGRGDAGLEQSRLSGRARDRGLRIIGALYGLFIKFQAVSTHSAAQAQMFRNIALLVPFGHVLFCTMVAWDFEMTLTPGWSSAIFAMYHIVSSFGMMLSVLVLTSCC